MDNLVKRLRGQYAMGPHTPNGDPEFGWRQFESPPIQHEAADCIEALEAENARLRKVLEPFAFMSSEGVIKAREGHVEIVTCAEYFHEASALIEQENGQ